MPQLDATSVDGDTAEWANDGESSVSGDAGRRRRYNYAKCAACREQKKKCEPVDRVWPEKCKRCIDLGLGCSEPEDIRAKSGNTSHPLRPNAEHAKLTKQPIPKRPRSFESASLVRGTEEPSVPSPTVPPAASVKLCLVCQSLDLSRSRFIIPSRGWKSAINRTPSRLTSPPKGGDARPRNLRVELGLLRNIQARAHNGCSFCDLVYKAAKDQLALATPQQSELDLDAVVQAIWEIDGRELIHSDKETCFFQPVTRHIRLSWGTASWLRDAYVILCGDDLKLPGLDLSFLGRTVQSAKSHERIKAWIEDCNERHAHCSLTLSANLSEGPHLRVIDLDTTQLVPLTPSMDYVVLSYTWSSQEEEIFLKNGYDDNWLKDNLEKLPKTTIKAIALTRELGIRYLWVDSLCIIQDLKDDKQANYCAIETVLANAFLTICAAITVSDIKIGQHINTCGEKLSLMVHHPVETHIRSSKWSKGAWTCQDRLLSGRCLIFTQSGVWFQCQEESMSEDTFEPSFQGRSADWVQSPAQIWSELAQENSQFRAYIKCVESYTSRQLPREGHALRAFAGISNFLGTQMKTRFFSGLPNSYFDAAILWTPATGESRTRETDGQPVAPSWSWAGWTGQATYRPPILTGAVENIWDWLMAHTWISWYLVDRNRTILGEIGTFAAADLPDVADSRDKRGGETGIRFKKTTRPYYKDDKERWPSRKRREFSKNVQPQLDRMDTDGPHEASPYFLLFWTWSAFLRLGTSSDANGIKRYTILDRNDDICGSIVLPDQFVNDGQPVQFIATSDARLFFDEEMPEWTYYIPKERHDSSWDLWYVMLIEPGEDGVSKRVGVGKVFKDAFHQSFLPGMDWREFILG
ncbi:hypothetical protein QBC34DRAFT_223974 [Podospora aff. communis PSN243]|uniref:Zn(2)-C6 fungal-type domain-containing protein n=1 Tax=Podospora aff. communis PSN243 TaxID=3040156 RepID=A0AAV9G381_9PEZI|nr:hypothetical protein QBC34DRAFT_223974 [Podospora aff. communis PSN243]